MAFWVVRAGKLGEQEQFALEHNCVVVGWDDVPDLAQFSTRPELRQALAHIYRDLSEAKLSVWTGQLWSFSHEIKDGDLIALPRKHTGTIAIGKISGKYTFVPSGPNQTRHQRPVNWIDQDFARQRLAVSFP
jgi:restriction system protein